MSNSQAEIKAIQERLRAMRSEQTPTPSAPSSNLMVELFPNHLPASPSRSPHTPVSERSDTNRPEEVVSEELLAALRSPNSALQEARRAALRESARLPQTEAAPVRPLARPTPDFQRQLESKVQQINQLAAAQEAAMLEFKTLAERLERDRKALELQAEPYTTVSNAAPLYEYVSTAVPHIEQDEKGSFVLKTRAVDLFQSEREAALIATRLRRSSPEHSSPDHSSVERRPLDRETVEHHRSEHSIPNRSKLARRRSNSTQSFQIGKALTMQVGTVRQWLDSAKTSETPRAERSRPQTVPIDGIGLQEGLLWFVGATIARVGIDLMLVAHPGLWLLAIALIAAPAAIAVYRVTVQPQTSIVWGYRLLAIMLGLLLGGRL